MVCLFFWTPCVSQQELHTSHGIFLGGDCFNKLLHCTLGGCAGFLTDDLNSLDLVDFFLIHNNDQRI